MFATLPLSPGVGLGIVDALLKDSIEATSPEADLDPLWHADPTPRASSRPASLFSSSGCTVSNERSASGPGKRGKSLMEAVDCKLCKRISMVEIRALIFH